jgi:hypothetical protein
VLNKLNSFVGLDNEFSRTGMNIRATIVHSMANET